MWIQSSALVIVTFRRRDYLMGLPCGCLKKKTQSLRSVAVTYKTKRLHANLGRP